MVLSPTGRRSALALGADTEADHLLRVDDLRRGKHPARARPAKIVPTEERTVALEWAPDERCVAAVSLLFRDGRQDQPPDVRLRRLDLAADQWTVLASWRSMAPEELEVPILKALSWTT